MLQRIAMGKLQSPKIGPRGKTAIPHKSCCKAKGRVRVSRNDAKVPSKT